VRDPEVLGEIEERTEGWVEDILDFVYNSTKGSKCFLAN
jgi:hypothetical protein